MDYPTLLGGPAQSGSSEILCQIVGDIEAITVSMVTVSSSTYQLLSILQPHPGDECS